ncbi:Hypothetical_protein [Hexamita inflata]|uniref:Hypothetical_protein n=1 Tax=Hexamita inflata TaxID=28002 RepID=A0AA86QZD1_9EUKA|nr:Hypothetical protein HINF_LOCUS47710 [Hexamita inflata]
MKTYLDHWMANHSDSSIQQSKKPTNLLQKAFAYHLIHMEKKFVKMEQEDVIQDKNALYFHYLDHAKYMENLKKIDVVDLGRKATDRQPKEIQSLDFPLYENYQKFKRTKQIASSLTQPNFYDPNKKFTRKQLAKPLAKIGLELTPLIKDINKIEDL